MNAKPEVIVMLLPSSVANELNIPLASIIYLKFSSIFFCRLKLIKECHRFLSFDFSPTFDWMRRISVRPSKHNRKVSLVFNHLEPMELAEHLSYLEYKAFRRINVGYLFMTQNVHVHHI